MDCVDFWKFNLNQMRDHLLKNSPKSKTAYSIAYNMNGEELLNMYPSLFHNIPDIKVVGRVLLREWLEKHGADFIHWSTKQLTRHVREKNPWIEKSCWLKQVGEGSFSKTHLLLHKSRMVVLKLQKCDIMNSENEVDLREIRILQTTSHSNILKMIECGVYNNRIWILLEYANSGTLETYIHSFGGVEISEPELLNCYTHIFSALVHLHDEKGIIHRDVKAQNIFIFKTKTQVSYKLGDFNLSRIIDKDCSHATSYCGSLTTMAPEMMCGEVYRYNADVWSTLCVVLFTILVTNLNPINLSTKEVLNKLPEHYKIPKVKKFICFMHKTNPDQRPTSLECLNFLCPDTLPKIKAKERYDMVLKETVSDGAGLVTKYMTSSNENKTECSIICKGSAFGVHVRRPVQRPVQRPDDKKRVADTHTRRRSLSLGGRTYGWVQQSDD
jgi:serine/threonine protein kinase